MTSKLLEGFEVNVEDKAFSAEMLQSAKQNYARFYEVEVDAVTIIKLEATPLQTAGWAYVKVLDYEEIERSRLAELDRVPLTAKCWAFDT